MLRPPVQDVSVIVPLMLLRGHSTCNQLANLHQPAGFQGNPLVITHWPKLFQECAVLPELRDTKQTTHFVLRLQAVFTIQGLTSNW